MTSPQDLDAYRPPMEERRGPRRKSDPRRNNHRANRHGRAGAGAQDGSKEQRVAEDFEFTNYYGKPVVKAPPWEWPIAGYFVLGGIAGGSGLLSLGAKLTKNTPLRRSTAITAFGSAAVGSVFLILDLGRPERLLNMFRVFKLSSPMNIGSWILASFSSAAAVPAIVEFDKATGEKLPLGFVRKVLHAADGPSAVVVGALGGPLAGYTAVLLADTSNPTWNDSKKHLPYVFASSATMAASGTAMMFTPVDNAGPARALAIAGAAADIAATKTMEANMEPETVKHYHHGQPGKLMKVSEILVAAGGIGTALAAVTKSRALSVISGAALVAGSACTRFGVLGAGLESAKDPDAVIGPQKRRAQAKMDANGTANTIITPN